MTDLERRVRSSLRPLTDALPVGVPGLAPPKPPRRDHRLVGALLVVMVLAGIGLIVWWPTGRGADRIASTPAPTSPPVSAAGPLIGDGIVEPPVRYWAAVDPVIADPAGMLADLTVKSVAAPELDGAVAAASELRAGERFGSVALVHVGTDGPLEQATYDALLAELVDVPHVVIATVHGDQPWTAANNDVIRGSDAPDDNIVVFDWAHRAPGCPGDCRAADGIALRPDGRWYYAEQLAGFIGLDVPERPADPATRPVAAITVDGDAVLIPPGADTPQLLHDGPSDGTNVVDSVAVSIEQNAAYVALCCEPISGELYQIDLDDPARPSEPVRYAAPVAASPTGQAIAVGAPGQISAGDPMFSGGMGIPVPNAIGTVYDLDWFDSSTIDTPASPFPIWPGSSPR